MLLAVSQESEAESWDYLVAPDSIERAHRNVLTTLDNLAARQRLLEQLLVFGGTVDAAGVVTVHRNSESVETSSGSYSSE